MLSKNYSPSNVLRAGDVVLFRMPLKDVEIVPKRPRLRVKIFCMRCSSGVTSGAVSASLPPEPAGGVFAGAVGVGVEIVSGTTNAGALEAAGIFGGEKILPMGITFFG